jgi:hypothetical protein
MEHKASVKTNYQTPLTCIFISIAIILYSWVFLTAGSVSATCSRWFLARRFFYPEDGGNTFLQNVVSHKIYMVQHPEDDTLHYIKVYVYFLVKFCTFGFILIKSATVFHFRSDYVISYVGLSYAESKYVFLTGTCCLEMKHNHNSQLTNLSGDTVYASLINESFLLLRGLKIVVPLQAQG